MISGQGGYTPLPIVDGIFVSFSLNGSLSTVFLTIIFSTIFEIKTPTQVGVPDSKIALHVNVHFYTDKVVIM